MLFIMKNNRLIDNSHVCDLFADGKKVLSDVSYATAYAYVLNGQDEDTYFEQDTGMTRPQTVREMRERESERRRSS